MSEKDTRWDSIVASCTTETVSIGDSEYEMMVLRATVWSDRFHEHRSMRWSTGIDRLEAYDWLYARTLELMVRDLETLDPR